MIALVMLCFGAGLFAYAVASNNILIAAVGGLVFVFGIFALSTIVFENMLPDRECYSYEQTGENGCVRE